MACEACGGVRPCRGERNGTMLCAGCRPRPKRPCAYCGNRRTVTIVWAAGPACSSCYRAFCRAKGDCPRCGAHRRLLPYKGFDESLCAACAGVAPDPICESCGNEDWLYERGRCARCVLVARLETLLGDHASRHARGLELLFAALVVTERPESTLGWLRPTQPAAKLLARLASGELSLDHDQLDALAQTSARPTISSISLPLLVSSRTETPSSPGSNTSFMGSLIPSRTPSAAGSLTATSAGSCCDEPGPPAAPVAAPPRSGTTPPVPCVPPIGFSTGLTSRTKHSPDSTRFFSTTTCLPSPASGNSWPAS